MLACFLLFAKRREAASTFRYCNAYKKRRLAAWIRTQGSNHANIGTHTRAAALFLGCDFAYDKPSGSREPGHGHDVRRAIFHPFSLSHVT
jgi:hypothetical protein